MKPTLLILAAGMGSRYGGIKQIDKFGPSGEAIIDYSIFDAVRAGFGKIVFVIRKSIEKNFRDIFIPKLQGKIDVGFVFQELENLPNGFSVPENRQKPWGTGHAVLVAKNSINEPFAVINADDFYGYETYKTMYNFLTSKAVENTNTYCMVGYKLENTLSDYGHVSRGICKTDEENLLVDVKEVTKIWKEEDGIKFSDNNNQTCQFTGNEIVSMNTWGATPAFFTQLEEHFSAFISENINNPKAEFYIPTVINSLIKKQQVSVEVLECNSRWFGVTYKEDKKNAVLKIRELIDKGEYPAKLW